MPVQSSLLELSAGNQFPVVYPPQRLLERPIQDHPHQPLPDQPFMLVMVPDPHPDEVGAIFDSKGAMTQADPC